MKNSGIIKNAFFLCAFTLSLCRIAFANTETSDPNSPTSPNFDLPTQPLESALIEFGLQSGNSVIADHDLVISYKASPVFGRKSVPTALSLLLAETPLSFTYSNDNHAYVIHKKNSDKLETTNVKSNNDTTIEEVVVTGYISYPFRYSTLSNTQTRGDSAFYDPSRFINILPKQLIDDQQPHELSELLKFASGVTPGDGFADTNDDLFIRGFQRHALYLDNFRLSDSTGMKVLPANIERVEILKGPATLLFGQAEPGGIVNVVRKKPQNDSFVKVETSSGDLGFRENTLDVNSTFTDDHNLNYRLVLTSQQQSDAQDAHDILRSSLLAEVQWIFSPEATFDMGYEYQKSSLALSRDFPVFQEGQPVAPGMTLEQMVKHKRPEFTSEYNLFNAEFNYFFVNDWHLRADYYWQDETRLGVRTSGLAMQQSNLLYKSGELGADDLLLILGGELSVPILVSEGAQEYSYGIGAIRSLYDEIAFETGNNINLSVDGKINLAGLTHKVLLGGSWLKKDLLTEFYVEDRKPFGNNLWTETDFNTILPQLVTTAFSPNRALGNVVKKPYWLVYNDYGSYIKDSVELTPKLSINAGVRYTETKADYTNYFDHISTPLKTYQKLSTQFGTVYQLNDQYSLFGNYSEAMRANYHTDDVGTRATEPELSYQQEAGFKYTGFSGKLQSSFALFHIHKINIADTEQTTNGRFNAGFHDVDVRGVDIDITTQVSSKLDVIIAMSVLNPEITSGENSKNIPALTTQNTETLGIHYQYTKSLGVNLSASHVGKRYGDNSNIFKLQPYTTLDADISYLVRSTIVNTKIDFSMKNITDQVYRTAVLGGVRENYSQGRSFFLKFSFDF